jgi:hypothetical protein
MTVISKETIDLLQNFSTINKSIVIKPGNEIQTLSLNKNILAKAKVEETFTRDMAIYDLPSLIAVLNLFEGTPVINTEEDTQYLLITNPVNRSKVKFFYSDPDIIVQPPVKDVDLPTEDVKFRLEAPVLQQIRKAWGICGVPDLCLYGHKGVMNLCLTDKKNETSNSYSVEVGDADGEFCYCFKMENLKLYPQGYDVTISKHNVARFEADNVKYLIALEPNN